MEEMPKNYDPSTSEPAILQKWLDGGYYKRREGVGDCTVTIPPPNVTGKLHMGHATDDSIQDAVIRMARMRGKSTRWVLGTDHAGIATQTKVDKKLKSEGISRLEIGRDKFVDACWDWTHEYGGIIVEQIKRMGCSVDFDNERFVKRVSAKFAISTGSACTAGMPSHVLQNIGKGDAVSRVLRISLSAENTIDQVEAFLKELS